MYTEAIDIALGHGGSPPKPLDLRLAEDVRDAILHDVPRIHIDCDPPRGELAEWAVALLHVDKVLRVRAAVAVLERAKELVAHASPDLEFVDSVLEAIRAWLASPKGIEDLRLLGELWYQLVRNPPSVAHTSLGDAASAAWWVAGYDPEGWGEPPDEAERLERWLRDAADNRGGIVDVFLLAQRAVPAATHGALVASVRACVRDWRERAR